MASLFNLEDLSVDEINKIIIRAVGFSNGATSKVAENKVIASLLSPVPEPSSLFPWQFYALEVKCLRLTQRFLL